MKKRYKVDVTVYLGSHDYTVEVEADDENYARYEAESKVFAIMKFDDFSSHMDISANSCEEKREQ